MGGFVRAVGLIALGLVVTVALVALVMWWYGRIRRRTRADFQALAARFGLVEGAPTRLGSGYVDKGMIAVAHVDGIEVVLTPRRPRKVTLLFDRRLGCRLSTERPVERPTAGLAEFSFGDPFWDRVFLTRYATRHVAAWLWTQVRAETPLTRVARTWADSIRADPNHGGHLTLEPSLISCALAQGSVFKPTGRPKFLRRADGERLIPDLVALARWVTAEAPGPDAG